MPRRTHHSRFDRSCPHQIQHQFRLKAPQLDVCPDGFFCRSNIIARRLYIIEERHEAVVHVQLLVAVEEGQPWIVSNKVYLGFLVSAQHHNIFQDSSCRLPGQARQLKTMTMEVDWMDIVTGIAHTKWLRAVNGISP